MDFLSTVVPAILTITIGIAAYRNNKMAMPLAVFLVTYVGVILK
jgi:hypothetical protein